MASGTLVEGGGDVPGVKNRWIENRVYKRKVFRKGGIKNNNGSSQQPPSSQTVVTDGNNNQQQPQQPASDVSTSIQHQQVVAVRENGEGAPTENGENGSVQTSESHLNIHLSSMSKQEIREVKLKLVDELEQVRNLLKQVEAKELELNGVTGDATVATAGDATVGDATVGDDGCTGVSAVGVEGRPGVGVDVESYNHSDLSANEVVDNGVGSKTMPEFCLDDVDGDRRMIPEFSLNDDGVDPRTIPEFTLNDGGEQRMSLDDGADRRMIPEFSLDDGGDRSTIPEISLDNGGGRIMVPEFRLDIGGGNGMIPEVTVKTFGSRGMVSEISLDNGGSGRVMSEVNLGNGGGTRRRISEVSSVGKREPPRSLHQLRVSVMENSHGGLAEYADKEKRTPKANQYYRNSDFIVGKERLPPPNKKSKINGSKKHGRVGERDSGFNWIKHNSPIFKNCSSLLTKLMKHKHGWVFNAPVDVEALGLRDYFYIIKHPMDLGTVKERLNTNWYRSPKEFAEDVRLTFRNAMTYNPAGQDVHVMADILSQIFEDRWAALGTEYELNSWLELYHEFSLPTPVMNKTPRALMPPPEIGRYLDRVELTPQPVKSKPKLTTHGSSGRGTALKKPKAKDQNKRDMTYEEKQKLSKNLQSLPTEKLDAVVEIMRRRTSSLVQNDDSIEVDIDSIDTETLWELDRFVTNYKKSLSKYKRRAELAMKAREEAERNAQQKNHAPVTVEVSKETKSAADEKNTGLPPPLKADKQQDNSSRSSSSSSSSSDSGSSSSDSDSDSSSGSDAGNSPKT